MCCKWGLPGLAVIAALLIGGAAYVGQDKAAQDGKNPGHDHHAMMNEDPCARACSDCQRMCDSCAAHCGHQLAQGKKEHLKTLQTCQDCATHCGAAACIVSRHGPFSDLICKACAEACARCGQACDQFPQDEHMKRCAEECKKCEKACRDMLQHAGGTKTAEKQ